MILRLVSNFFHTVLIIFDDISISFGTKCEGVIDVELRVDSRRVQLICLMILQHLFDVHVLVRVHSHMLVAAPHINRRRSSELIRILV